MLARQMLAKLDRQPRPPDAPLVPDLSLLAPADQDRVWALFERLIGGDDGVIPELEGLLDGLPLVGR